MEGALSGERSCRYEVRKRGERVLSEESAVSQHVNGKSGFFRFDGLEVHKRTAKGSEQMHCCQKVM